MTLQPTDEQLAAVELFRTGESIAIEAGAGTGKTSTLQLLAESTNKRGVYIAYNRSIAKEAGAKMPGTVAASTAHSLAFRAVGKRYSGRLNSPRMRSMEIARRLKLDPITLTYTHGKKVLAAGYLAGLVMRSIGAFCQSADEEPTERHVPYIDGIDLPHDDGTRTFDNNRVVSRALVLALRRAWSDVNDVNGSLPFKHDHYLKIWQLSKPQIGADFVLFDEAQDADPCLAAVVAAQDAQRVYVGDAQQQLYEWRGAIDALARIDTQHKSYLTQSFRFGPAIAEVANGILERIDGAVLRLKGTPTIASVVAEVPEPDAVLCRTNAKAVGFVMSSQRDGKRPHLVGGGTEVLSFARAAAELQSGRSTTHPELACFDTWGDVTDYVQHDEQGGELRMLVDLIGDYGTEAIITALGRMPSEPQADVIVSTGHKSKGREWDSVQLANDFNRDKKHKQTGEQPDEPSAAELRLLYVSTTRARRELDISAVGLLNEEE